MDVISILVSLDQAYLPQLQVLLTSIFCNNPGERFAVYLLHSGISEQALSPVAEQCRRMQYSFCPGPGTGRSVCRSTHYQAVSPGDVLPAAGGTAPARRGEADFIPGPGYSGAQSSRPLWELELDGNLFAAAAHTGKTELANNVNRLRLGTRHDYYNSGVLLMDLEACRARVDPESLFHYVLEHGKEMLLPPPVLFPMFIFFVFCGETRHQAETLYS